MVDFQQPFYKSNDDQIEIIYNQGVLELQSENYEVADNLFRQAAQAGHASANYNLALMHGSGTLKKLDIDFAARCVKQAAAAGHPNITPVNEWLTKAENATLGTTGLAMIAGRMPPQSYPSYVIMMVACRFYNVLCQHFGVADQVVKAELHAAHNSEHSYIQRFIKRTGLSKAFYDGGMYALEEGSPADQITDGLNELFMALLDAGNPMEMCLYVRCSIVGYIIQNSNFGNDEGLLLGYKSFLKEASIPAHKNTNWSDSPKNTSPKASQSSTKSSIPAVVWIIAVFVIIFILDVIFFM